jgi:hypothetical protein
MRHHSFRNLSRSESPGLAQDRKVIESGERQMDVLAVRSEPAKRMRQWSMLPPGATGT